MKEISTEIEINAPSQTVWDTLINFEDWPNWNPSVNKVSGHPDLESTLSITMRGKDGRDTQKYNAKIITFEAPNKLTWQAKMMSGLMLTNNRVFELSENNGKTKLIHKEAFGGLMAMLMWSNFQRYVPVILNATNEALKKKLES